MLDERDDAPVVVKFVALAVSLVRRAYDNPALRNASSRRRCASMSKLENGRLEDLGVRLEGDLRCRAASWCRCLEVAPSGRRARSFAGRLTVGARSRDPVFRQSVDHRYADAMQTARDLVAVVVELSPAWSHRQHDFLRRTAPLTCWSLEYRAVCPRPVTVTVDVDGDVDLIAETAKASSDGVVDHSSEWCNRRPVDPITNRRPCATASRPSRTLILSAP